MDCFCRWVLGFVFLLVLFSSNFARSQTLLMPDGHSSAQGQLTVTATVVCSASVVWDEKGTPQIMLANCPDPADNVSQLRMIFLGDPQTRELEGTARRLKTGLYTARLKGTRADVLFSSKASGQLKLRAHQAADPHFRRRIQ